MTSNALSPIGHFVKKLYDHNDKIIHIDALKKIIILTIKTLIY